jgi:hypothetical protein
MPFIFVLLPKSYLVGLEDLFLLVFEDFVDFGWELMLVEVTILLLLPSMVDLAACPSLMAKSLNSLINSEI